MKKNKMTHLVLGFVQMAVHASRVGGCWVILLSCAITIGQFVVPTSAAAQSQAAQKQREFTKRQFLLNELLAVSVNARVAREMELTDKQKSKMKSIFAAYRQTAGKLALQVPKVYEIQNDASLSLEQKQKRMADIQESQQEILNEAMKIVFAKMDEILLPHQVKRLKQIALQKQYSQGQPANGARIILSLADELDLSKKQLSEFKEETRNSQAEYEEELKKLREKYDKKIVRSLPEKSRKKLDDLIGDIFYK